MRRVFGRRTVVVLVLLASLSFASALFWFVFGGEIGGGRSYGTDSFSRSAVGHHAFVRLLEELGVPVVRSRWNSAGKAGEDALLLLLEPQPGPEHFRDGDALQGALRRGGRALLVLPKRRPREDPGRRGWVVNAPPRGPDAVTDYLRDLDIHGEVVHAEPERYYAGEIGIVPTLDAPVQLLVSDQLSPIVSCAEGTLLGTVRSWRGTVYLLADPDLISTRGLGRGDNAALAVRLVEWARGGRGAVVVDEVFHGHGREPSVYRALFEWPLLLATLQAALTVALLLWAAMGRFGAPRPARPPLEPGKASLISNIAALLEFGGHGAHALGRYLSDARAEVEHRLHLPQRLGPLGAREWLDRVGKERGARLRLAWLEGRVARRSRDPGRVVAVARLIHRWKEEMIHGRRSGA